MRHVHTQKHIRFIGSMTAQIQALQVSVCVRVEVCAHTVEGLAAMLHTAGHAIHRLSSANLF